MAVAEWIVPLISLTGMEIVLGIDNIVFIAIIAGRLPPERQQVARRLGLVMALGTRLLLLLALSWVLGLTRPLFALSDLGVPADWLSPTTNEISGRDLLLIGGGLFLIGKSTYEIHESLEGPGGPGAGGAAQPGLGGGADRRAGRGLLPRLGHHCRGHGQAALGDGDRNRDRGGHYAWPSPVASATSSTSTRR